MTKDLSTLKSVIAPFAVAVVLAGCAGMMQSTEPQTRICRNGGR